MGAFMTEPAAKNTGKPYESLAQQVFNEIANQDAVKTIQVQRDVVLQGLRTQHQIDVYWEFEFGGISYCNVVEAKDWGRPVDQGEVIQFKGVLDDLPNQPRGIFVTRTGFQSGAIEFAKKEGIILYELREPTDADWEGRVKGFLVHIHAPVPNYENVFPVVDKDWVDSELTRRSLSKDNLPDSTINFDFDGKLYAEDGSEMLLTERLLASFFPTGFKEIPPTKMIHAFDKPTFMHTNTSWFPRLKLAAFEATVSVSLVTQEVLIKGTDFIHYILKNVFTGEVRTFEEGPKLIR
jgi:Restriction endonuclease